MNRQIIKAILNSKKSLDLNNFSKKDIQFICSVCIEEYRKLKILYDIMKK